MKASGCSTNLYYYFKKLEIWIYAVLKTNSSYTQYYSIYNNGTFGHIHMTYSYICLCICFRGQELKPVESYAYNTKLQRLSDYIEKF